MILADTLELIHILCVFLLLGALGMITYSSVMSAKTDDVRKFEIYQAIGSTGGMFAGIMSLFVGMFGTLTAWKIGYSLDAGWLIAAYIATSIAFLLPLFTFKPWASALKR